MDIPDYMLPTYQLNDVASLQYENITREAYTLVIDDSKDRLEYLGMKFMNPTEFLLKFTDSYLLEAENRKISDVKEFSNNGNLIAQAELSWTQEGNDFFMIISVIETKTHFYKLLSWSLLENRDQQYDDFIKISKSLKD
ncbi:MAG: hypothetical protein KIT33_12885 [Candidatus Kapabacteria bacterium]|nr:hypothetical protein [Ignavibacteriota bacterium]MCW5885857.1 hypothetical protein [Candidatus Kapabacteria bacterium]